MRYAHAMPFGARLIGTGRAEFNLWAPKARAVALVLHHADDEQTLTAQRGAEGWWRAQAEASGGQLYRWRVDGLLVPDPASRFNPEGPHGPSCLVDAFDFDWDGHWCGRPWHEAVLYELHVGCFTPEGTFAAAERELPRLASLGITAVQLMPLASWPGRFGWGYDGVLPFAPHAAYGTPHELKHFIDAAHRLGLMVLVDVVYNHFGPDGNFLPHYAPQFFSDQHRTAWGAAINFDGEGCDTVREFFVHNALYWAEEYRVDGLRFDAVHAIVDERRPDILQTLSQRLRQACAGRQFHLVIENDSNDVERLAAPGTPGRFDGQWNGDFHHTLHVRLTGERDGYYAEYDRPVDQLATVLTRGFAFEGGPHNAEHAKPRGPAVSRAPLLAMVNFLHNHDQIGNRAFGERLSTLAPAPALRLATAMCLLGVAPPLLFMGEEFASRAPFLYFADWQGELREAVRQGRQREFARFERYAHAAALGELPDPCSVRTFERSRPEPSASHDDAQHAWRRFVSELLAVRQREVVPALPRLRDSGHRAWRVGEGGLVVRWRFDGERMLQMRVNLHGRAQSTSVAAPSLDEASTLYTVGEVHGTLLGPWSGAWHWGHA